VDTGGWQSGGTELDTKVSEQAAKALEGADLVLFVVDVTVGLTDDDVAAARVVQRNARRVLLVVNKVDDPSRESAVWAFVALGLGDPRPISALHGRLAGDLLDAIVEALGESAAAAGETGGEDASGPLRVAIVGRPNVGKSTLFNALLGDDRSIVHDLPGTT